ncbi:MAG: hypothetical protein IPJ30_25700 [Acidobacteria bacterium]|nr:hypothetical protein [Acidobacteriota bacterium]
MTTELKTAKTPVDRAMAIADLGLVTREGDRFVVSVPQFSDAASDFYVWRDADARIRCSCRAAQDCTDLQFRCEHMLAVKFAIKNRNSEPTSKRSRAASGGNVVDIASGKARREERRPHSAAPVPAELSDLSALLARMDPAWSHAIREVRRIGNFFVVTAAVTVNGVTREGIGTGTVNDAHGVETAERIALKHAIVKFEASLPGIPEIPAAAIRVFPSNPIARSLFDLVTAKQLGMIRAMSRELGIKADEECEKLMDCRTDELSKRAASRLIEHLQELRDAEMMPIRRAG